MSAEWAVSSTNLRSSTPVLVGFGKNYYHNFGPSKKVSRKHVPLVKTEQKEQEEEEDHALLESYQFHDENNQSLRNLTQPPPWEDDPLVDVSCTIASTHFLTRSGGLYVCGTIHGQVKPQLSKITIPLPLKCVQLATGRHFCIARMEGGLAVCAWGAGHFGQLGLGGGYDEDDDEDDYRDRSNASSATSPPSFVHRPTVIEHLLPHMVGAPIATVAAGYWHALAATEEGTVYAWGCNRNAQCGKKPSTKDPPTICQPQRVIFERRVRATKLAAGRSHSVVLDDNGRCYSWGANQYGQCGILSRRRIGGVASPKHVEALAKVKIVDITAGDVHTLALTGGGRVFGWGGGFEGQLGTGYIYQMNPKPKLVSDLDFVAIEASQENLRKSTSLAKSKELLDNTPKIISVTAKGNSSFAISSSGHVYAWGCNDVGNLGLPKPDVSKLTYSDPGPIGPKSLAPAIKLRQFQTHSFDSSHNIALPQRLDSLKDYEIKSVAASSTFVWYLGTKRESSEAVPVGRTLYEVRHQTKHLPGSRNQSQKDPSSEGEEKLAEERPKPPPSESKNTETGWARSKKPPAAARKSQASSSTSMEFSRSSHTNEEVSEAFSVGDVEKRRSSILTPGRKKRLFSPKKLIKTIVRRASGVHGKGDPQQKQQLPTIDLDGTDSKHR
eukprot:CAMPEP_0116153098 /NCGR_PEP_ID=MMETSP0329-20121206/21040_1 /TAXON_ID=697910 /ORGANISM="Pseudo-nitzschia arenysensis, Strain B593" /LENGTH=665 /DNA_ID=CAMNT_0003649937 /DNA_START=108 /DNA_END=2105 /DNA_ORIENTATION=-